jgi:hypothetical protein
MDLEGPCATADALTGGDVTLVVFATVFCVFLAADTWIAGLAVHRARKG